MLSVLECGWEYWDFDTYNHPRFPRWWSISTNTASSAMPSIVDYDINLQSKWLFLKRIEGPRSIEDRGKVRITDHLVSGSITNYTTPNTGPRQSSPLYLITLIRITTCFRAQGSLNAKDTRVLIRLKSRLESSWSDQQLFTDAGRNEFAPAA